MVWRTIGFIDSVISRLSWSKSHAQVPTILELEDRIRVYFATRPRQDMTYTTFCDLDKNDLMKVIYVHDMPILELGGPGTFDQHGIMPSAVIEKDGVVFLYYSGWCRSVGVPYNNYTGLAISEDGGTTFKRKFLGPVVDRTPTELYSATSPCVYYDGNWHMYYCSGTHWHAIDDKLEHTYDIKYASSFDGIRWVQNGRIAIPQKDSYEAITKPSVIYDRNIYHMWYCYRGSTHFRGGENSYRIGYAKSKDLNHWERMDDEVKFLPDNTGWDDKMKAYPAVFRLDDETYMAYNGNDFGAAGFGLAKLSTD